MPLITRQLKGSKLSIEEMDSNLTYLENLAISNLRDYVQLQNKPLVIDQLDRWNTTKDLKINNHHLYVDGPFSIRFVNHVNEGGANYLMRVWDWDGPSGQLSTPYQNEEVVYYERAQITYEMETSQRSSVTLKTFDWTGGSQSGVGYEHKFYQGSIILPNINAEPTSTNGAIAISDGVFWNPSNSGKQELNVRLNGSWKQVNFGVGATGPTGPAGPKGDPGPGVSIVNFGTNRLLVNDGTETGVIAQSDITYDGVTFTIDGDLSVSGDISNASLNAPILFSPQMQTAKLDGSTTLQNISTVLVDTVSVTIPIEDFDYNLGSVFYVKNPQTDFEVNLTNVPITTARAINVTIILSQTGTTYGINGFRIDNISQTIKWVGSIQPVVLPNKVMAYSFNIIRSADTWSEVLGSAASYG